MLVINNKLTKIDEEVEFILHSNLIEQETSLHALVGALLAWQFARLSIKLTKLDLYFIKCIHHRLMESVNPPIAGKFRQCSVWIGGTEKSQSVATIEKQLKKLCKKVPKTEEEIKQWHIDFENIHPFEDGNGRTGRIIMNAQRLKAGLHLLIVHVGKEQQEYYKWFR